MKFQVILLVCWYLITFTLHLHRKIFTIFLSQSCKISQQDSFHILNASMQILDCDTMKIRSIRITSTQRQHCEKKKKEGRCSDLLKHGQTYIEMQ